MEIHELARRAFARDLKDPSALEDAFDVVRLLAETDLPAARKYNKTVRAVSGRQAVAQKSGRFLEANRKALLFDAPYDFDCFIRYIEWNREPSKRFYIPRRKQLKPLVDAMQELAEDKLDLLAISLPPGTGKTTLAIFYLTWMGGRSPDLTCLGMSHNASFLNGVYNECLRIIKSDGEYPWSDVFPVVKIAGTNAKDMRIDLGNKKRFETLEFSSIGSGNAGKVRATNLLYCDDLCSGIEEALSKDRLDKLWQLYTDDARQRKQGNPKELHIATRWSVHDVIGRLESRYGDSDRAKFIVEAAMDENDESRFDYAYGVGFSTQVFREQREMMDDASWRALYMSQPIERAGQLFPEKELNFYNGVLPDGDPIKIAVCDVAWGGGDSVAMPFAYVYGEAVYIADVVFNPGAKNITYPVVIGRIKQRLPHRARFEANNGGEEYADHVDEALRKDGIHINIISRRAPNTQSKLARIIQFAPDIKRFYFLDNKHRSKEYNAFMKEVISFMQTGKNKHDDAPDSLAMLADELYHGGTRIEIFPRPF